MVSCDQNKIIDQNFELHEDRWYKDDSKTFEFEISDTISQYNVFVNVRNNNEYPYRNLYLFLEMTSPSDKFFMDTVEVMLADSKGRWLGSGTGNIWQNQVPILKKVRMLESGTYRIRVVHGMRHDTLEAISDIGIRVEFDNE